MGVGLVQLTHVTSAHAPSVCGAGRAGDDRARPRVALPLCRRRSITRIHQNEAGLKARPVYQAPSERAATPGVVVRVPDARGLRIARARAVRLGRQRRADAAIHSGGAVGGGAGAFANQRVRACATRPHAHNRSRKHARTPSARTTTRARARTHYDRAGMADERAAWRWRWPKRPERARYARRSCARAPTITAVQGDSGDQPDWRTACGGGLEKPPPCTALPWACPWACKSAIRPARPNGDTASLLRCSANANLSTRGRPTPAPCHRPRPPAWA